VADGVCEACPSKVLLCVRVGLGDRVDALIAGLKAGGVMSPKLGSIAEVFRAGSPLYKLNPSLFIEEVEQ